MGSFMRGAILQRVTGNREQFFVGGKPVLFGANLLFSCVELPELIVGCEICEDLWVADTPATAHALEGATILVNLSASNETVGKAQYRELLVKAASARLLCGYVYASAGEGESTQDLVFGGHNLIGENGTILKQSRKFENTAVFSEIDVQRLSTERRRMNTFGMPSGAVYSEGAFSSDSGGNVTGKNLCHNAFCAFG